MERYGEEWFINETSHSFPGPPCSTGLFAKWVASHELIQCGYYFKTDDVFLLFETASLKERELPLSLWAKTVQQQGTVKEMSAVWAKNIKDKNESNKRKGCASVLYFGIFQSKRVTPALVIERFQLNVMQLKSYWEHLLNCVFSSCSVSAADLNIFATTFHSFFIGSQYTLTNEQYKNTE